MGEIKQRQHAPAAALILSALLCGSPGDTMHRAIHLHASLSYKLPYYKAYYSHDIHFNVIFKYHTLINKTPFTRQASFALLNLRKNTSYSINMHICIPTFREY